MGQIAGTAKSSPEAGDRRVSRSRVMSLRVGISPRCRKELRIAKECHADSICCFFAQAMVTLSVFTASGLELARDVKIVPR